MYRSVTKRLGWTTFFTPVLLASCGGGSDKQLSTTLLEGMTTGSNFGIVDGDDVFELDATSVRAAPDRPYYSEAADILGSGMLVAADAIFPDKSRDEITERLIVTAEQLDQSNWTERYLVDEDLLQPEMRALFVEAFSDEIVPTDEQLLKLDAVSRSIVLMNVELNEQRARGVEFDKVVLDLVHREFLNQVSFFMDEGAGLAYRFEGAAKAVYAQNIWSQLVYTDTALGVDRVVQPVEEVVEDQALTISGLFEIADASSQAYQFGISGVVSDNNIAILDSSIGRSTIMESTGLYSFVFDDAAGVVQALGEGQRLEVDVATFYAESAQGAADRLRQTLTVAVTGVNDAPEFSTDSQDLYFSGLSLTARPLDSVSGTLQATDVDQGDVVSFQIEAAQSFAEGVYTFTGLYGVLALNSVSGAFTYEVDPSLAGSQEVPGGETVTETVSIIVTDSSGATDSTTVTFAVAARNDEPTAVMSSVSQNEGVLASGTVVSEIELSSVDVFTDGSGNVLTAGSQYSYALTGSDAQDFEAVYDALTDKVLVRVKDGVTHTTDHEASSTLDINLVVTYDTNETVTFVVPTDVVDVNEAPVFGAQVTTHAIDVEVLDSIVSRLVAADVDAGDTLTYGIMVNGAAVLPNAGQSFVRITGTYGTMTLDTVTGSYTYRLLDNDADLIALLDDEDATDSFNLTVTDSGGLSATEAIDIVVTGKADNPTLTTTALSVDEQNGVQVFAEVEVLLTDAVVTPVYDDLVTFALNGIGTPFTDTSSPISVTWDNNTAEIKIDTTNLDADDPSTLPGQYELVVTYEGLEQVVTIPVTVLGLNDEAPVTLSTTVSLTEDAGTYNGQLRATDAENNVLEYQAGSLDNNNNFTAFGVTEGAYQTAGTYGVFRLNPDGFYSYELNNAAQALVPADANKFDSFTIRAVDIVNDVVVNAGNTATLRFDITGVQDEPVITFSAGSPVENVIGADGVDDVIVGTVVLTDVDTSVNAYSPSLSGTDAALFSVIDDGAGSFVVRLKNGNSFDYETSADRARDVDLVLTLGAETYTQAITYDLQDINEAFVLYGLTQSIGEADVEEAYGLVTTVNAGVDSDPEARVLSYIRVNETSVTDNDFFTDAGIARGDVATTPSSTWGVLDLNQNGEYSFTRNANVELLGAGETEHVYYIVEAEDSIGAIQYGLIDITVTGADDPLQVSFDHNGLAENSAVGTLVGAVTLTDVDRLDDVTQYDVTLSGVDAAKFSATQVGTSAVWNITVAANAVIDFEADNNLDITLVIKDETNAVVTPGDATQDDLVITVLDVDEAPIITSNIGSGLTYETNFYGNTGNNDGDYVIRLDENDLQASGFTGAIPVTNPDSFDVKIIPATTQTNGVDVTAGNGNNTVVADMTLGGSTLGISLVLDEEGDFLATLVNDTAPANASIMGKIEGLARGESYLDQLASGDIANTVGLPFEYVDVTVGPNGDTSPEAAKLFFDIIGSDDWQSLSIVFGDAQSGATIVNVGGAVNVDLLDGGTQSVTFANRQIQIDESATANNAVVGDLDILDDDDYTFAIKSSDLNKGVAVTADGAVSITSTAQLQTADAADGADDESVIITFEATNAFYGTADQNDQGLDGFSFQIQFDIV